MLPDRHSAGARRPDVPAALLGLCAAFALVVVLAACSDDAPAPTATPAATPVDYSPGRLACVQMRVTSERAARQGIARLPEEEYRSALERIAADYAVAAQLAGEAEPEIRDAMSRLARTFETLEEVDPDEILKAPALAREACKNAGYL